MQCVLYPYATLGGLLSHHRYRMIPLFQNSGLIGWVPHSDTLHTLIRDYQEKKMETLKLLH